jgi:hypothetical protein
MANFKKKTRAVIAQLKKKLETTSSYPTLGHFYREIELLKFPWMAKSDSTWFRYGNNGRNVYAGSQYDSIVNYCREQGWISIITGSKSYTVSSLIYHTSTSQDAKCIVNPELHAKIHGKKETVFSTEIDKDLFKVELALDPEYEWVIKMVNGKSYLSVKK